MGDSCSSSTIMAEETGEGYKLYKEYLADTEKGGRAYQVDAVNHDAVGHGRASAAAEAAFTPEENDLARKTYATLDANMHQIGQMEVAGLGGYFAVIAEGSSAPLSPAQRIKMHQGLTSGTLDTWLEYLLNFKAQKGAAAFGVWLKQVANSLDEAIAARQVERNAGPRGAAARVARLRAPKVERVDEFAMLAAEMKNEELDAAKQARASLQAQGKSWAN